MAKGAVCKTAIYRFNSGRRLNRKQVLMCFVVFVLCYLDARVAELADARDLKSLGEKSPYRFDPGPGHIVVLGAVWLVLIAMHSINL